MTPLLGVAALAAGLWRVAWLVRGARARARVPRLALAPAPRETLPVSAVVPARDEARNLGPCLASLTSQTYPALEIVVVDDGSRDGTPAIIAEAARRDPRVRGLRVEGPPPGWTGKAYAAHRGAAAARGRWLWFTDADTVHAPEALARALGLAQAHGVSLLSATSRQLTGSLWERAVQPVVFGCLDRWFPLDRVNDPASPVAAANGIFLLIARDAYEAVGGHAAVAGEIVEDLALARRVKASGRRIAFVDGGGLVAARMYTGFRSLRAGWVKNLYALRDRRPGRAVLDALELGMTTAGPLLAAAGLAAAGRPVAALGATAGAALALGAEAWIRRRRGEPARDAALAGLGGLLVATFLLESAFRDWCGWGVTWKGRRYTGARTPATGEVRWGGTG